MILNYRYSNYRTSSVPITLMDSKQPLAMLFVLHSKFIITYFSVIIDKKMAQVNNHKASPKHKIQIHFSKKSWHI